MKRIIWEDDSPDVNVAEFPNHMLDDALMVGFPDTDTQESVYRIATFGKFLSGHENILDVGCGRGDLGHYILNTISGDVSYTGISTNSLHIDVGKTKYQHDNMSLQHINYSDFKSDIPIDIVFHIFDLSTESTGESNIDLLDRNIKMDMEISKKSIYALGYNNADVDGHIRKFNLYDIVEYLSHRDIKFILDNSSEFTFLTIINNN